MIIGPFLDDHFTARDHTLSPERSIGSTIDYSKKFDNGQGQMLRWQALQVHGLSQLRGRRVRVGLRSQSCVDEG